METLDPSSMNKWKDRQMLENLLAENQLFRPNQPTESNVPNKYGHEYQAQRRTWDPVNDAKKDLYQQSEGIDDSFFAKFGTPGAGNPLRTESGAIQTNVTRDKEIELQGKFVGRAARMGWDKHVPNAIVHDEDTAEYIRELNTQRDQNAERRNLEKQMERSMEIEQLGTNPFAQRESERYKSKHYQRRKMPVDCMNVKTNIVDVYDPWGKGTGNVVRDSDGDVERHPNSKCLNGLMTVSDAIVENGKNDDAPPFISGYKGNFQVFKNHHGQLQLRDRIEDLIDDNSPFAMYNPWGKPGAGAPRLRNDGSIETTIFRQSMDSAQQRQKNVAARMYLSDLKGEMKEQFERKVDWEAHQRQGAEDFSEQMRRGQVGKPQRDPQTGIIVPGPLKSSDVTVPQETKMSKEKQGPQRRNLANSLAEQVEQREQEKNLEKLQARQEAQKHYETANGSWGKPAPGVAPPMDDNSRVDMHKRTMADTYTTDLSEWRRLDAMASGGLTQEYTGKPQTFGSTRIIGRYEPSMVDGSQSERTSRNQMRGSQGAAPFAMHY